MHRSKFDCIHLDVEQFGVKLFLVRIFRVDNLVFPFDEYQSCLRGGFRSHANLRFVFVELASTP